MSDRATPSDGVSTKVSGAVLEVTLDRPKANAIDLAASRRLNEVFSAFRDDPTLRVAIVTGAGERFFCAGWDLKAAAAGEESDDRLGRRRLRRPQLPAQPRQAADRRRQRHRLRRRLRAGARHRHHRDGGAGALRAPGDQRRRAGGCRHHQAAPPHSLPRRGRIPHDRPLDGRAGGQALGPRQPRGATGLRPWRRRARSRSSSPTGRRCCSRPSNSCCATPRWSRSTRRSRCTTR